MGSDPAWLILASLADGPKHGYAMVEDIEAFAGVRLGPGTLYGALTRLEEKRWIAPVASSEERRRPYRLTAVGAAQLKEQTAALARAAAAVRKRLRYL